MELWRLLSASQVVAQIISFLILLFILRALVWKRFLRVLDERRDRIAAGFKDIEGAKADVSKIKAEYEKMFAIIEETARAKKEEAISEGKRIAGVIRENAQVEAEKIITNAGATIRVELSKAKDELKEELVDLTIDIAGRVIEERLTEKEDRILAENFLKKLGGS